MKAVFSIALALSVGAGPVLAWGSGDCPFSKEGTNQEASTEREERSEPSN